MLKFPYLNNFLESFLFKMRASVDGKYMVLYECNG